MTPKRFALLDRDGTIIAERNYLCDPDQVELLPNAVRGLKRMRELGLGLVIVTNQSGLGRGYFNVEQMEAVNRRILELLAEAGVSVDGVYHCPHRPDEDCDCRKPRPGMARAAAEDLGFKAEQCFMVGDKPCDIDLGRNIRAATFLVRTGYGAKHEAAGDAAPDHVVDDLWEAARVMEVLLRE